MFHQPGQGRASFTYGQRRSAKKNRKGRRNKGSSLELQPSITSPTTFPKVAKWLPDCPPSSLCDQAPAACAVTIAAHALLDLRERWG